MAISVDWVNKIITIPQADLAFISAGLYSLDINTFRLSLKALEDDEGITFLDTHRHESGSTLGGVTFARIVEIINGYQVLFENGTYAVNLVGANSNIADVAVVNSVSLRSNNSAGLIQVDTGGTFTNSDRAILQGNSTAVNTLLARLTDARSTALDLLQGISDRTLNLMKGLGRVPGISATQRDPADSVLGFLRTSDGAIDQTIEQNPDGSVTISEADSD